MGVGGEPTYGEEVSTDDGPLLTMPHATLQLTSAEVTDDLDRTALFLAGIEAPEGDDDEPVVAADGYDLGLVRTSPGPCARTSAVTWCPRRLAGARSTAATPA